MSAAAVAEIPVLPRAASPELPRLLAGLRSDRPVPLDEHLQLHGPAARLDLRRARRQRAARSWRRRLSRGGEAARGRRRSAADLWSSSTATEAEPVSGKDKLLLRHLPHLVLDGAVAVATALGAREAIVVIGERAVTERAILERALEIRGRRRLDGKVELRLAVSPGGFVSGEETAVVNLLNGRRAYRPSSRRFPSNVASVVRRPLSRTSRHSRTSP